MGDAGETRPAVVSPGEEEGMDDSPPQFDWVYFARQLF